ncbi:OmpH family outer membrane protein [Deinococcus arcticus]|uniref:Outer membrane chaperone OmpH n=1 Tax=Deinococcus arcticus TaxID=2136176 RepID=A0A2T3WBK9_9DEIO|nr:OmpH family outer membrane protein [Deinococcus arcticus]PTA69222.1 outer membrane chaperone OmpH [Deinococcus arcticus]
MNKMWLILPLALLSTVPHAQQAKSRLAIVNVQQAVKALPDSKAYLDLNAKVAADLNARQKALQDLSARAAATRSAADRQALAKAQQAYASARDNYATRIDAAFKPLATKLNAAVAKAAKANGYTIVFDEQVAAQTSLVVYANETATNLTPAVIKNLK